MTFTKYHSHVEGSIGNLASIDLFSVQDGCAGSYMVLATRVVRTYHVGCGNQQRHRELFCAEAEGSHSESYVDLNQTEEEIGF